MVTIWKIYAEVNPDAICYPINIQICVFVSLPRILSQLGVIIKAIVITGIYTK